MKSTDSGLMKKAISELAEDMRAREIGAILWDNSTAGFHFIPEVTVPCTKKSGNKECKEKGVTETTLRVMGIYDYDGRLYLIEEGKAPVKLTNFYTDGVEVPPTVVTLTPDMAQSQLGDPTEKNGYTDNATNEEWLAIADCYFEALNER